jgi:hypothetical protein
VNAINFNLNSDLHPTKCHNGGFGDVVHHEYGHNLVLAAGSGQEEYGEGMGDVMALLATDNPRFAVGWQWDPPEPACDTEARSASNTCQYNAETCSDCEGFYDCATVLSGCVWDTRVEMIGGDPVVPDWKTVLRNLAINAMLLHTGSKIDPSIYVDWLIIDDDNGDLQDGTPH